VPNPPSEVYGPPRQTNERESGYRAVHDTPQPVAYDQHGNPLYSAPPPPQVVYVTRPADPGRPAVPADIKQRHEESRKKYPHLNLSEGEFVILSVKRHPIGLVQIWGIALMLIAAMISLVVSFMISQPDNGLQSSNMMPLILTVTALLSVLVLAGAGVAAYVYNRNRFYLTNESVIQELQNGLFSKREQTVSLGSIEDASYFQTNLIASMFNYGLIRLSTVGDETTYRFNYVTDPKRHIAILNNAVEDFKNGRSVH